MAKIELLSEETIDKIAAGEVIERPGSVVKELVENAIDAGAKAITVEIKEGGISFIRVTDDGEGIEKDQVKNAFYRHATSKLRDALELMAINTLGFRGEALSSIAAVAQVELITKTQDALTGVRYVIEGAIEKEFQEVGVPKGTTILVKNLFFNTPVRRNFLKSPTTEGSYINELCERMALSKPDIAFQFIQNGQVKFHTSGSGNLEELVYRIFGREIAKEIIPVCQNGKGISISGVLGKPTIARANRNYENYFVNGRYIKSNLIAKAVEEGYKGHMMQHKFPFFILNIDVSPKLVDVNVHPTKMDVRFSNAEYLYDYIASCVSTILKMQELIPQISLNDNTDTKKKEEIMKAPEPFEKSRMEKMISKEDTDKEPIAAMTVDVLVKKDNEPAILGIIKDSIKTLHPSSVSKNVIKSDNVVYAAKAEQISLFETPFLSKEAKNNYEIIGQLFDTYWLIAYHDKLLIMDQHAAHEKVRYEHLIQHFKDKTIDIQSLNPPVIISLTPREADIVSEYKEYFQGLGFEIEDFGGSEVSLSSVPMDLYGQNEKDMFISLLAELCNEVPKGKHELIYEKMASMACKAAVKGNMSMSKEEVTSLLMEMMELENPYNCPHGRPTIISMTKYELEKKFKRIL